MKQMSFFKKLKLFRFYKKSIKNNRNELEQKFNVRIDRAYRLYTVLNVPEEVIGEAYILKKSDVDRIAEAYIKDFSKELGDFLNSKGMSELYDYYTLTKVDKYSWHLVMGFSLFRSNEWYDNLYFRYIPIGSVIALITGLLIYFL
jgi:hypothetical protein